MLLLQPERIKYDKMNKLLSVKTKIIAFSASLFLIFVTNSLHATQDDIISRSEEFQNIGKKYYENKDYKAACDYYRIADSLYAAQMSLSVAKYEELLKKNQKQTEALFKNTRKENKIRTGIIFFILLDMVGLFFFLFLEKKRAYYLLVKKNMDWATESSAYKKLLPIQRDMNEQKDSLLQNNVASNCDKKEQEILIRLIEVFENDKVFLNSEISIQEIAKMLGTNRNCISRLINSYFEKTFPALLNEYRIKEAIKLLIDSKSSKFKLEAIGEMSGFRNRQVFHSVFKKETGLTPNDFKQMSVSKEINQE
jgi:YesN/AraC family two-component response regulator